MSLGFYVTDKMGDVVNRKKMFFQVFAKKNVVFCWLDSVSFKNIVFLCKISVKQLVFNSCKLDLVMHLDLVRLL